MTTVTAAWDRVSAQGRLLALPRRVAGHYLTRRLLRALAIIWVVTTLVFFVIRLMPGNAVELLALRFEVERNLNHDEAVNRAAALLHINLQEPVIRQYFDYMGNIAHGDLGLSYVNQGKSVAELIGQRLPWTLFSVGGSLLVSFVLGMTLGTIAAYRRNTWLDHLLTNLAAALDATPAYLMAILLVLMFGVIWHIIPIQQMRGTISPGIRPGFNARFFVDAFQHVLAPAFVYVLATVGGWVLSMKSSTLSTLGEDYVTVARARGLPDSRIISSYVGRNASLPLFTALALSIGFAIGGSILIEQVFTYPGIGLLLVQSITTRDYPTMQGILLVTTAAVVISNLLADLLYGALDPRIRIAGGEG